jgi:NADH:ubiquinone oxidoreductase subunit 6 (subunit J)
VSPAIFYLAGALALGSAASVVLQRNPFLAALSLVLHLASLATLYILLIADFVAAAQVLVYAGAVMIMFLFVIAYLGERAEVALTRGGIGAAAAVAAGVAIFLEVVVAVTSTSFASPASVTPDFGSPAAVGRSFLTDYLLAFEVVSLLLLVGAVAGVVLGGGRLRSSQLEAPLTERHVVTPTGEPEPAEREVSLP